MAGRSRELELAIRIAGKVDSSLKGALGTAVKEINTAAKALEAVTKGGDAAAKTLETTVKKGGMAAKVLGAAARGTGAAARGIGKTAAAAAKATVTAAATASRAAVSMGSAAVDVGKEFEKSMSQVSATMLLDMDSDAGKAAFETLENAARECGRSTAFSATEAAEGLNYLALAGYNAEKAAGALPTVLKFAGAGAMELAAASDMITDSMSALGLEATEKNLTEFADKMAKTASRSNTSVAQLGEAVLTVGGTASGLAGGTTELNTALGILADSGIKAAEGGTHLRNMILSLQSARNSDAAALFEEMGLSAYTAEGNMRSLGDIFGDLNTSLSGATAKEVNSTLATIFKQTDLAAARAMLAATADSVESLGAVVDASLADSGTSMAALGISLKEMADGFDSAMTQEQFAARMMNQFGLSGEQAAVIFTGLKSVTEGTGNRFQELSAAIEDSAGACDKMYAIQLDNLEGDIAILQSGLQDLGISVYKDLNGPLREVTKLASSMVGKLSSAYQEGGMFGMAGAVGDCLEEAADVIASRGPRVIGMGYNIVSKLIEGISENAGSIAGAVTAVLPILLDRLQGFGIDLFSAGADIILELGRGLVSAVPDIMLSLAENLWGLADAISQRAPEAAAVVMDLVQGLADGICEYAPDFINSGTQLLGSLLLGVLQMLPGLVQAGAQILTGLAEGIVSNLPLIIQMAAQAMVCFISGIAQMIPVLIQAGIQIIISLIQGIIANLGNIAQAAVEIVLSLITGLLQAIPQLAAAVPELVWAIIEAIMETDWLQVGIDIITGIIKGILNTGKSLWNAIKSLVTGEKADSVLPDPGEKTVQNYTAGASGSAEGFSAAGAVPGSAFQGMDFGSAFTAGENAGAAFLTGFSGRTASPELGAKMVPLGSKGAGSLRQGMASGTAGADTAGLIDAASLQSGMAEAGKSGASALKAGFGAELEGGILPADIAVFSSSLASAGAEGAAAASCGLADGAQAVTSAAAELGAGVNSELDAGWEKARDSARTAMQKLAETVSTAAQEAAQAVRSAFENLKITIPDPKVSAAGVSTGTISAGTAARAAGRAGILKPAVNWNAVGGIFEKPAVFSTSYGLQGAGEAGPEALLPLDTLWTKLEDAVSRQVRENSGESAAGILLRKLEGIGSTAGGSGPAASTGTEGISIQYSPVFNLYGSAGKEEVAEAAGMCQKDFDQYLARKEKEIRRRAF